MSLDTHLGHFLTKIGIAEHFFLLKLVKTSSKNRSSLPFEKTNLIREYIGINPSRRDKISLRFLCFGKWVSVD